MIIVKFNVEVNFLDDSAHYPRQTHSSFFYSKEEMTDDEIREKCERCILPLLFKFEYKIDTIMRDPSFIGARVCDITVQRDVEVSEKISLKGPAVDYYGKEMSDEEIERAWVEIKKKMGEEPCKNS